MIRNFAIASRIVLGLTFFGAGLNGFFHFFQMPTMAARGAAFVQTIMQAGYLWELLNFVQIGCGIFLTIGIFVPLSIVVLFPVVLNVFLFHVFLNPRGTPMGAAILGMEIFLIWCYRRSFRGLLLLEAEY